MARNTHCGNVYLLAKPEALTAPESPGLEPGCTMLQLALVPRCIASGVNTVTFSFPFLFFIAKLNGIIITIINFRYIKLNCF